MNELVARLVNGLDTQQREDFEERAGIMEFDAQLPRDHAECLALLDVLHRHPVTVLAIELDGASQWLLTTNLTFARQHLMEIGGLEQDVVDLAEVIKEQYAGIAKLTTLW
jgi:hypothetical protein